MASRTAGFLSPGSKTPTANSYWPGLMDPGSRNCSTVSRGPGSQPRIDKSVTVSQGFSVASALFFKRQCQAIIAIRRCHADVFPLNRHPGLSSSLHDRGVFDTADHQPVTQTTKKSLDFRARARGDRRRFIVQITSMTAQGIIEDCSRYPSLPASTCSCPSSSRKQPGRSSSFLGSGLASCCG